MNEACFKTGPWVTRTKYKKKKKDDGKTFQVSAMGVFLFCTHMCM